MIILGAPELPLELAYQYKYSIPGFPVSWEIMVTKLQEELIEDPKPIEISTTTHGGICYDQFLSGILTRIFLTRSKISMLSSDLDIEPIYIRRDMVSLPIMFPNGRFFFRSITAHYIAAYMIYL